jgi:hypothetical protein
MKYRWDGRSLEVSTCQPSGPIQRDRVNRALLRTLSKNAWKRAVDLTLYLVFCLLAGTGFLIAYRLPHGPGELRRITFLGHGLHDWGMVHRWLAYVAIGLVLVHLVLNREWLTKIASSGQLSRLAAGILVGLLILAGFLLFPTDERGHRAEPGIRQSQAGVEEQAPAKPDY